MSFGRRYSRKAREIILAAEITRRYSKDEILELYLNEIYYGNLAYGIEAAVLSVALNRRLSLRLRVDQQAPLELSTAGAPPRSP